MTVARRPLPRVSILIVCHRHVDLLLDCLASLRRHLPDGGVAETIVLFNGTPDAARERVQSQLGADQVLTSSVNLGFGAGNNRAARHARGEYLVFLNDDTEIRPGWLEALLETAEAHPEAGAVGSRILHPDGSLQEAGSLLWRDGSTLGVGRGLPSGSRQFDCLREVDYASACSLLVRKDDFEALGGFDERYFPGYYEDVDLCLSLQARRLRILYQPRSVVVHHESQTGADAKTFLMLRGRAVFREKWRHELERRPLPPPAHDREKIELAIQSARRSPRRLLVVDDRVPDPSAGSGFGRMLDVIRELAGAGWAISLYPTASARGEYRELQDLGVEILQGDLAAHLLRPAVAYDVAIVSRPHNLPYLELVRRRQPQCALIYDAESLFHRRLEREAALLWADNPAAARAALHQAEFAREQELRIVHTADRVVSVTAVEADFLRSLPGACPVEVIDSLSPQAKFTATPFAARRGLVLVAGWLAPYPSPNSDGLEWFMADVMPMIAARVPWVRLSVTGAQPHREVRSLEGPRLRFLGRVDDLGEVYAHARVAIVPVRFGAGIKIKAVEALQYGVPVVTTPLGAEGIEGAGPPALAAYDDPAAFAARVIELLTLRQAWEEARAAIAEVHAAWTARNRAAWSPIVEASLREKTIGKLAVHG